jgi:hypothetical protein
VVTLAGQLAGLGILLEVIRHGRARIRRDHPAVQQRPVDIEGGAMSPLAGWIVMAGRRRAGRRAA